MKGKHILITTVLMFILVLSGCGSKDADKTESTEAAEEAAVDETTQDTDDTDQDDVTDEKSLQEQYEELATQNIRLKAEREELMLEAPVSEIEGWQDSISAMEKGEHRPTRSEIEDKDAKSDDDAIGQSDLAARKYMLETEILDEIDVAQVSLSDISGLSDDELRDMIDDLTRQNAELERDIEHLMAGR